MCARANRHAAPLFRLRPFSGQVHDQHIWADAPDKLNLTAHIVVRPGVDGATVLYAAREVARQVGCQHTVFQVEDAAAFNCDPEGAWPCVARTQPAAP